MLRDLEFFWGDTIELSDEPTPSDDQLESGQLILPLGDNKLRPDGHRENPGGRTAAPGCQEVEGHAKRELAPPRHVYLPVGKLAARPAIWVQKPWKEYAAYYDMTADVYAQRFDDFWQHGLRVTSACVYRVGSERRYSAVWERLPGPWGHWFHDRSSTSRSMTNWPRWATGCTRSRHTPTGSAPSGPTEASASWLRMARETGDGPLLSCRSGSCLLQPSLVW